MNEDIVINTKEGLEVVNVPQSLHEIAYDLATQGPTTITTTGGSEIFHQDDFELFQKATTGMRQGGTDAGQSVSISSKEAASSPTWIIFIC